MKARYFLNYVAMFLLAVGSLAGIFMLLIALNCLCDNITELYSGRPIRYPSSQLRQIALAGLMLFVPSAFLFTLFIPQECK